MPKIKFKRPTLGQTIYWVIGLSLAISLFIFARGFFVCFNLANIPGTPLANCANAGGVSGPIITDPQGTPLAGNPTPAGPAAPVDLPPPSWDGGSRVNVLFIGIDSRDWEVERCPRSDTMIVFTIDPITKTAGMLSIPRDMWVNIPGSDYGRINQAYNLGCAYNLPGGGPALAMQTASQFLGVPINYYAQVDFDTFIQMIDTIGGIDVLVKEKLILDPIGEGMDHVAITPGVRHLTGWKALAYARTRHTANGDVDRAQRQQQVVFAILNKVFTPDYFPTFVKQAPDLYNQMSAGIHTNISFEDGLKLAVLLSQIPRSAIKTGIIDQNMTIPFNTTLGGQPAAVLKPIAERVRVVRDEIFGTGGGAANGPLAVSGQVETANLLILAKQENPRIRILNGTFTGDLGQRAAAYFQGQFGLNVTELGNTSGLERTTFVIYSPKLYSLKFFMALFGANSHSQIKFSPDPASTVDIEIRLGTDAIGLIP